MNTKLQKHTEAKVKKVNGWDLISISLGLAGTLCLGIAFMQPKNPANMLRLPGAILLFSASVAAERLRESDLMSLNSAVEYQKNIQSDRIRRSTVIAETMYELEEAEDFFARLPQDRWELAAQRIGIAPPNYAARQPDPVMQQIQTQAKPQVIQTIEPPPDPTGDFDPEEETGEDSGITFIPAVKVNEWFAAIGESCPQTLVEEWQANPGKGIEVIDGKARIVGK